MRLRTYKPNLRTLDKPRKRVGGSADKRAPESVRTRRRLKLWAENPHCRSCGVFVDYPFGFELDHIKPLSEGGPDTEENSQILCVWIDEDGKKQGCHVEKSREEAAGRAWVGLAETTGG